MTIQLSRTIDPGPVTRETVHPDHGYQLESRYTDRKDH